VPAAKKRNGRVERNVGGGREKYRPSGGGGRRYVEEGLTRGGSSIHQTSRSREGQTPHGERKKKANYMVHGTDEKTMLSANMLRWTLDNIKIKKAGDMELWLFGDEKKSSRTAKEEKWVLTRTKENVSEFR